jgi:N-acetylglutamate synthase-like GNAT family acetyltransferase
MKEIKIEKAVITDADEILKLQLLCYQSEAELCNDSSIPPLTQTVSDITSQFDNHIILKAADQNIIIGSARAYQKDHTCDIGRVIVHPDYQNRGIGKELMRDIENCFIDNKRYELFTGSKSIKNIYFYKKLGYNIFKTEKLNNQVDLVYLEKYC